MGHLGGGSERDVSPTDWFYDKANLLFPDRNVEQNTNPNLAGIHNYILVSFLQIYDKAFIDASHIETGPNSTYPHHLDQECATP